MLRTESRKQTLEESRIFHGNVMLDLKCLECTENGIRFLRSFWPKNENMHGTAARSIIFGRQGPAKEAKWVHNGGKRALTKAARAQKMRFVMQCARSRFAK